MTGHRPVPRKKRNYQIHLLEAARTNAAPAPVKAVKVRRSLWNEALKRVGGNPARIQIVTENQVIVWNSTEQKEANRDKYSA